MINFILWVGLALSLRFPPRGTGVQRHKVNFYVDEIFKLYKHKPYKICCMSCIIHILIMDKCLAIYEFGQSPVHFSWTLPRLTFCINSQAVVKALGACKFEFM